MVYWSSCGSDQAMCLEELLVADSFWVANGERLRGVILPSFFVMTHMDSVTQNIQLVSNLLQSYWLSTSEDLAFEKHQPS